ncbi:MAG: pitrilysin family protein [Candidatus Eremiobacterota bacterium]
MKKLLALLLILLSASALAQKPDRSVAPRVQRPPALRPLHIERRKLRNGVPVLVVERHKLPVVSVSLILRAGSAADPPGRHGLANLTAGLLEEGAGTRNALEFADELDYLGAALGADVGFDGTEVELYVPVARLKPALDLMADMVLRPTFPEGELERVRKEMLVGFEQLRDDPESIASLAFPRILFGQHRYGTPGFGTAGQVSAITRADLVSFHAAHYRPDRAFFVAVGDVRTDEIVALLDEAFGAWGGAAGPAPEVPDPPQRAGRTVYLVDKPGAAQSEIRIGWVGVPRTTPDYYSIQVMNTVLGGSFTSRLNQNLREQHGYTYGAGSRFSMRRSSGPFVAYAAVQTDKTAEAVREFLVELERIRQPVPEAELTRARNYLAFSYPADFETCQQVSGNLAEVELYGLPPDTLAAYVDRILAVSADDVARVARAYVQPDNFAVVVVGDLKAIRPGLEKLKLGPIQVVPLEDALGP